MEEKKSSTKKVVAIVVVIIIAVLAVLGTVGFMFVNDIAQRALIGSEMEAINTSGKVDTEIKSTGKYADVEKALKDYVVEYQGVALDMAKEYQNEKFTQILSADNYKNDGPEFKESKELIKNLKAKGDTAKNKLTEMVSNEYKEKRATDSGLSGKYKDLFMDSIQLGDELKEIESTVANVNNYLDKVNDIFDFLSQNKGKWEVKNNQVQFKEMSLLTKYNSLVSLVNIAAKKLS